MSSASTPLRLDSVANLREHWTKKRARTASHRAVGKLLAHQASLSLANEWRRERPNTMRVTLTRIAPRKLDDDNMQSACKALRDGVADYFGVDDGSNWYEWRYEQRKGRPKEYAVEVTLEVVR